MDIKILFFGQLREQIGSAEMACELLDSVSDLAQLKAHLIAHDGVRFEPLLNTNLLMAINQTISTEQALLKVGDEVAFFPPVTGG